MLCKDDQTLTVASQESGARRGLDCNGKKSFNHEDCQFLLSFNDFNYKLFLSKLYNWTTSERQDHFIKYQDWAILEWSSKGSYFDLLSILWTNKNRQAFVSTTTVAEVNTSFCNAWSIPAT